MGRVLYRVSALVLAAATLGTCVLAGSEYAEGERWRALLFALSIMAAFGAHAAGHFFTARRNAVNAHPPCFVPAFSLSGIGGVYTRLSWPMPPASLFRIFAAGPFAGFVVSALLFLAGLPGSHVVELSSDEVQLGAARANPLSLSRRRPRRA